MPRFITNASALRYCESIQHFSSHRTLTIVSHDYTRAHNMTTPSIPDHVYVPLSSPREIRIAVIEPAMDVDAPLRFSFHHDTLEELESQYEAISYVWGEPILSFPVYHVSDGTQIHVTHNLDRALRRLRHKADPRWLWADAMCINQVDNLEKASQIPLMVDIFRNANGVLAWLHPENEGIERGMRFLDHLSRHAQVSMTGAESNGSRSRNIHDGGNDMASKLDGVATFFQLPYFQRLWIVQEIVFNLTITLICGKTELSWIRLTVVLLAHKSRQFIQLLGENDDVASTAAITRVTELWKLHGLSQGQLTGIRRNNHNILDLVSRFGEYGCTDPRDRIFALHSMARANGARVIIDYGLDTYSTYRNFALALLNNNQKDTGVLLEALARRHAKWPSWVPDWRLEPNECYKSWPKLEQAGRDCMPIVLRASEAGADRAGVVLSYLCMEYPQCDATVMSTPSSKTTSNIRGVVLPSLCYEEPELDTKIMSTTIISTASIIRINFLQGTNLFDIVQLFRKCWGTEAWDHFWHLHEILVSVLPRHSDSAAQLFTARLREVWRDTEPGQYESDATEIEDVFSDIPRDYCFFEAFVRGTDSSCLCFGSLTPLAQDVLVMGKCRFSIGTHFKDFDIYRALVLRPGPATIERSTWPQEGTEPNSMYRLVGQAYVFSPARTGVNNTRQAKIYLC